MVNLVALAVLGYTAAINTFTTEFSGRLVNYQHLKVDNSNVNEEVVLAWTTKGDLWVSYNQGEDWQLKDLGNVLKVYPHAFANERVYISTSDKMYYSDDHAKSFNAVKLPGKADVVGHTFSFNKQDPNYLILHTIDDCDSEVQDCSRTAWYTRDSGRSWMKLHDSVRECRFVNQLVKDTGRDFVFCDAIDEETSTHELLSSNDYFKTSTVNFDSIVGFALDPPFFVVAAYNDDNNLISYVTLDGKTFAPAHLPGDIALSHSMGYTVIDTSTQTLFMDVTTARQFGTIVKSNANGTDFVQILPAVNRNPHGFVDFEKVSIEGVALANIVSNPEDVQGGGAKVVKSVISHSDGAFWDAIPAPEGMCETNDGDCSLHLHGFTEKYDVRNTPDSLAAVGLIIATGNVGDTLLPLKEGGTFLSRDAGISWKQIAEEPMLWEYGDSGGVIVIARYGDITDTIRYSLDEGDTWNEYKFSDEMVQILNIANIPSDTSRKFIIFGRGPQTRGASTTAITIQFETPRNCHPPSDFYEWSPVHPQLKDECLFGHKVAYIRRRPEADCSIGKHVRGDQQLGTPISWNKDCQCTRQDFECDYNHERTDDGQCKLIKGKSVPTQGEQCANGGIYWRKITGYRKIAIDTCFGGEELGPKEFNPCPGMEEQFKELFGHHGPPPFHEPSNIFKTAFFLFFLFAAIAMLGLFIASYFEKTGRITLGDIGDDNSGSGRASHYLGLVVGVGALVVSQFKELGERLWGSVEDRFASRRNVYSRLDDDERARILSEHLSDDELDNPELDNFNLYEDEEE